MRPEWYGDKRDLVKWSVLLLMARRFHAPRIIQAVYFRESEYGRIQMDSREHKIPKAVVSHFRNWRSVKAIRSRVCIAAFGRRFEVRSEYHRAFLSFMKRFKKERCIVFLDPDTGLQPIKTKPGLEHVLEPEAQGIWRELKAGDVLALYQNCTNRRGGEWVNPKRNQLAKALGIEESAVKAATARHIAADVALLYAQKQIES